MKLSQKLEGEAQTRAVELARQYRGLIQNTPYAADLDVEIYATAYSVRIVQRQESELTVAEFETLLLELNIADPQITE